MIKRLTLLLVGLAVAAAVQPAHAASTLTFVGNGYVILGINGATDAFYDLNNQGNDNITPSFDSNDTSATAFSQTFTIQQGQSILLGGQLETFPQANGTTAFLGYAITDLNETSPQFSELSLPYFGAAGNNDQFRLLATNSSVDVGSSLPVGSYLLEIYEHGHNANDRFNQEGGVNNNWEARINVTAAAIPEPSVLSLLAGPALLGAYFFARRRRTA